MIEYRQSLDDAETELENRIESLWGSYENGTISAENFIIKDRELEKSLKDLKKSNSNLYSQDVEANRIFDWQTPRIFLIGLGARLPYVIFSLIITWLIMQRKNDPKPLRRAFTFLQVCCWSVSTYLMIWVFWYAKDFPMSAYRLAFVGVSILIGTAAYFFVINRISIIEKLNRQFRSTTAIVMDRLLDGRGYARSEKEYTEEILEPTIKDLHERTR